MENHIKYSKGVCWIGDCRIPFVDEGDLQKGKVHYAGATGNGVYGWNKEIKESGKEYNITQGRFTPNLLVCDDMLNDGSVSKSSGNIRNNKKPQTIYGGGKGVPPIKVEGAPSDKGTNSRYYDLDLWFEKLINEI